MWSAIFVLAVGGPEPWGYALAYASMVAWGAVIGVLVLVVLPPLPFGGSAVAVSRLGEVLAAQLADLAGGLRMRGPPTAEQWAQRRHEIDPLAHAVSVATRNFVRAGRGTSWSRELAVAALAGRGGGPGGVGRGPALVVLTEHLTTLLTSEEEVEREALALGPSLREPAAALLHTLGCLVGDLGRHGTADHVVQEAWAVLDGLVLRARERREDSEDDFFTVGAVMTAVRQALTTVAPLCRATY